LPQEQIFADFSGGMNALAAVDKLDPKECLLAENVRLDETGNIQSAGALTAQNTSAYAAVGGTNTNNVHSLFWNPSLGAVAGVGQDVFFGSRLGGMASGLAGKNSSLKKMSFASAPGRVYFDVGSTGYWTDMANLLSVDWQPPDVAGATIIGPKTVGTGVAVGTAALWTNANNITSTSSTTFVSLRGRLPSGQLQATMGTNSFAVNANPVTGIGVTFVMEETNSAGDEVLITLVRNGIPVGASRPIILNDSTGIFSTYTAGHQTDLWGLSSLSQADVNAGNFGFQLQYAGNPDTFVVLQAYQGQVTIYQGAGMVGGTGAAGTLTGTYTWKVAFVSTSGEESQSGGPTASIILSAQQGTLTAIPVGDGRTTARNLYRKGGALTSYYLVGTIQDDVSTTYADNQTDIATLATGVILAGDVPGDQANTRLGNTMVRFPVLHYDRMFWINQAQKNQIIWSKPLNGFAYPVNNQMNVGDSKPISRIVSIFGELIIEKTDSIWRLTGTDENSFNLTQTPSAVGTDESFTVAALPDKLPFANRYGLWVFNGYTSQPLTPKLDLWFKQDDRTSEELFGVNGFHPPEVASLTVPLNFEAVANSEKYVLAYAEAGQAANNAILIFDLKHGNITKRTIPGSPLSLAIDPVTGFIYVGDSNGFVSLLDDWNGATQRGSAANFDFQTGYFDLQRGSNKSLWAIELFLDTDGQSLTPSIYYDNGASSETLPAVSASTLQRIVRPVQNANARKMQNFSVRLNGSINPVNSNGSPAIQIVHVKALFDVRTGRARTGQ
jgi:hypothetical protein